MARESGPPNDFGARLRAARAYMDVSQGGLAAALNKAGASESTIKNWESGGKHPSPLVMWSLAPLLAKVSGLPEEFFWGEQEPTPLEDRFNQLDEQLRLLRAETAVRDAEVLKRIAELQPPSRASQSPRP